MAEKIPKAFLLLGGVPLLVHTLRRFEASSAVGEVVVLAPPGDGIRLAEEMAARHGIRKLSRVVAGGAERQDSVYGGLKALENRADLVLIHDGARPFVTPDLIERVAAETRAEKAAVAAVPVRDTIKEIGGDRAVHRTLNRESLWEIQTPQGFHYPLILEAYEQAFRDGFYGTDDAALVERLGVKVKVVLGSRFNLKITTPEDLVLGEALLQRLTAEN
jgi:2-C-methyl-D-erythritol 4-phosphate cytidylyltransferase